MIYIKDSEYRCAYKEVITIINILDDELIELIPNEKIKFYKKHMDENHKFEYDYTKEISEQNILYVTRCILANLFNKYIATDEDKSYILEKQKKKFMK